MNDSAPGPGWWKASDGRWYPSSSSNPWPPPVQPAAARPQAPKDDGLGCAGMIGVLATIIVMIIFAPLILFVAGWGFIIGAIISVAMLVVGLVIWLVTGEDPRE